jgi:hypothetical protein
MAKREVKFIHFTLPDVKVTGGTKIDLATETRAEFNYTAGATFTAPFDIAIDEWRTPQYKRGDTVFLFDDGVGGGKLLVFDTPVYSFAKVTPGLIASADVVDNGGSIGISYYSGVVGVVDGAGNIWLLDNHNVNSAKEIYEFDVQLYGRATPLPDPPPETYATVDFVGQSTNPNAVGPIVEVDENSWIEANTWHFEEVSETSDQVVLFDASRGTTLTIDYNTNLIHVVDSTGFHLYDYDVTGVTYSSQPVIPDGWIL